MPFFSVLATERRCRRPAPPLGPILVRARACSLRPYRGLASPNSTWAIATDSRAVVESSRSHRAIPLRRNSSDSLRVGATGANDDSHIGCPLHRQSRGAGAICRHRRLGGRAPVVRRWRCAATREAGVPALPWDLELRAIAGARVLFTSRVADLPTWIGLVGEEVLVSRSPDRWPTWTELPLVAGEAPRQSGLPCLYRTEPRRQLRLVLCTSAVVRYQKFREPARVGGLSPLRAVPGCGASARAS